MSELNDFPRGIFNYATLSITPRNVAIDVAILVRHVRIRGSAAAARVVTFRSTDGSVTYFTEPVPQDTHVYIGPFRIRATVGATEGGLEVLTDNIAADVSIVIFFHTARYTAQLS